jgi:hypothetical protein
MPLKVPMIKSGGRKDRIPQASAAELVPSTRFAVDGDEEEAAFSYPIGHIVG